ncbi:MAG: hypothetical protein Q8K30_05800 [Candidatus Gracilibacteria bacterium]|nr:hypothetical protein [Candidatus Gracilibacteria bacterium]
MSKYFQNYLFPDNYRESFMEFLNNPEKRDYLILSLIGIDNNVEEYEDNIFIILRYLKN